MREVFLFAGQSNIQNKGDTNALGPLESVPAYYFNSPQTNLKRASWIGTPLASPDTAIQWPHPTLANSPCVYNESQSGDFSTYYNGFGDFIGKYPTTSSGGTPVESGGFSLELSFLQSHLAAYPARDIGAVKLAIGGSALRGGWLPREYAVGAVQAATSNTFTLDTADTANKFLTTGMVGLTVKILSGAGAGQVRTVTAATGDAGSPPRRVTVSVPWTITPSVGDSYGIDNLYYSQLRTMMTDLAAHIDATDGAGNWRWAAFVWMQGESGAHGNTDGGQYLADARGLFAGVRDFCGRSDLPVLVGRIGNNWTNTHADLVALGYPYAAIIASDEFNRGNGNPDGRVYDGARQSVYDSFKAGADDRRSVLVTLGGDPHCAWWSNDDLPLKPPFDVAWLDYWDYTADEFLVTDTALNQEYIAYHISGRGQLAAGERAFAVYQPFVEPPRRLSVRAGTRRLLLRVGGG